MKVVQTQVNNFKMKDNILRYLFLAILGILFFSFVFGIEFFHRIELFLYDFRFELKPKNKDDSIVIITLDQETQKKYNYKQIPYSEYSKIIEICKNAKIIGIDNSLIQFTDISDVKKLSNTLREKNNVVISSHFSNDFYSTINKTINYLTPIPFFSETSKYGYNNYFPDLDGSVRRINFSYLLKQFDKKEKSFAYTISEKIKPNQNEENHTYLINYIGKEGSFKKYNFDTLLKAPNKYIDVFKDKIVIVGSEFDRYRVPFIFNNTMTRAEIHANNILTILNRSYINKSGTIFNIFFLMLMFSSGLFLATFLKRKNAELILFGITSFYFLFNIFLFCFFNIYLNIFTPTLSLVFSFFAVKWYFLDNKNREISDIRNIFKQYLAPQILDEFIKRKDYVEALKGERRVVTVLFADIADFTSISERLPTDQVVMILNEFLTKMTDVIFRNKGNLDKYTGDGIMAIFGNVGKINAQENAIRAVRTSLEMIIELEILQKKWISEGFMPFQIRIGISTGDAVVGNIGSPQQKDFTVIGDTVNIAARLEKLNKNYNTSILINKTTYEYVKNTVNIKNLGSAKLKGKDNLVDIFEVVIQN